MNACPEWNDRLLDLILGAAEPQDARAVRAHLASCAPCAVATSELRRRTAELDSAVLQIVHGAEPQPGFAARILASLETRAALAVCHPWRVALLAGAMVTALLLASVLGPSLAKRWPSFPQQAPGPAAVSTWRSPTDGLLRSSGEELLRGTPQLGEFYFPLQPTRNDHGEDKGGNKNES